MIFLFVLALSALADEPKIILLKFLVAIVLAVTERSRKIPLKEDSTAGKECKPSIQV